MLARCSLLYYFRHHCSPRLLSCIIFTKTLLLLFATRRFCCTFLSASDYWCSQSTLKMNLQQPGQQRRIVEAIAELPISALPFNINHWASCCRYRCRCCYCRWNLKLLSTTILKFNRKLHFSCIFVCRYCCCAKLLKRLLYQIFKKKVSVNRSS